MNPEVIKKIKLEVDKKLAERRDAEKQEASDMEAAKLAAILESNQSVVDAIETLTSKLVDKPEIK